MLWLAAKLSRHMYVSDDAFGLLHYDSLNAYEPRNCVFVSPDFATYFTVRSRALGSFLYSVLGSASIWLTGIGLDTKWTTRQKRAKTVFTFLAAAK